MTAPIPRAEVTVYSPLFSPFRQQLQGPTISIGRASDCSIPIKDRYLSRKHAEIVASEGHWILKDLGSRNGTFVGDRKVDDHELVPGDVIMIGTVYLRFEQEAFGVTFASADRVEGTTAFVEKRPPKWQHK